MKIEYLNEDKLTGECIAKLDKMFESNGLCLNGFEYDLLKMTIENTVKLVGCEINEAVKKLNEALNES